MFINFLRECIYVSVVKEFLNLRMKINEVLQDSVSFIKIN